MKKKQLFYKAFTDTLPVMAGYLVLGAGFGMIVISKGMDAVFGPLMSLLIYAGSMQFVAVDLLSEGASLLTLALTTLLVNARHLFYGISMIESYRGTGAKKPYLMFALTDETYSLAVAEGGKTAEKDRALYFFLISVLDHSYWVLGTIAGVTAGSFLKFSTEGIDFALTALFVTVFVNQWRTGRMRAASAAGVLVSLVCLLLFGQDSFLIPSMAGILGVLLLLRGRPEVKRG